jgi:hypothetical protein
VYKAATSRGHGTEDGLSNGAVKKTNVGSGAPSTALCCTEVSHPLRNFFFWYTLNSTAEIITASNFYVQSKYGGGVSFNLLSLIVPASPLKFVEKYFAEQQIIQSSSNVPTFSSFLSVLPN